MPFARFFGRYGFDDLLDHGLLDLLVFRLRRVLRREHHCIDRFRLAIAIPHRNLRLGIRPEPLEPTVAAKLRLAFDQPVREVNRQRHQLARLVARIAEHETLIARALLEVETLAFIDALRDVRRLPIVIDKHCARPVVHAELGVVVANPFDDAAGDLRVIDNRARRDLAREHDEPGIAQRLGGDSGGFVLR